VLGNGHLHSCGSGGVGSVLCGLQPFTSYNKCGGGQVVGVGPVRD
jgi:hypothetical protein